MHKQTHSGPGAQRYGIGVVTAHFPACPVPLQKLWMKMSSQRCFIVQGAAVYVPEKEALVWKIKSFPGGREFLLRAKFSLPSVAAEEEPQGRMPPMRVNFEIPYFTVSGIQVGSLPPALHR